LLGNLAQKHHEKYCLPLPKNGLGADSWQENETVP